jgi:hypothetical protein
MPFDSCPLGHVPKVRPYRRAGYVPATIDDEVRTVNAGGVSVSDARTDNRGIGDCQRRRFAGAIGLINAGQMPLNQRVPGSSPGAPTI